MIAYLDSPHINTSFATSHPEMRIIHVNHALDGAHMSWIQQSMREIEGIFRTAIL